MLSALFMRARVIFQSEGLVPLLVKGIQYLSGHLFHHGNYYLYKHDIKERSEFEFMPKIKNFTFRIISSNEQAAELAADNVDICSLSLNTRRGLDKGAVAFCVFVGRELAHIGWVAMTREAKNTFDPLPYHVDFSNGEACTGGTVTLPKYRGNGLMAYGYFQRFRFLRERGILISRNAVARNNVISQRVHAKFNPEIHAKASYLKILLWKYWKEVPITDATNH
jgi:hypothetical protein